MPETDWRDRANCLAVDPNSMQPERATLEEVHDAKRVCGGCPVRLQCRQLAESQVPAYGIHDGRWFGPDPVWLVEKQCEHCGAAFRTERDGNRAARFCRQSCQKAAWRSREHIA